MAIHTATGEASDVYSISLNTMTDGCFLRGRGASCQIWLRTHHWWRWFKYRLCAVNAHSLYLRGRMDTAVFTYCQQLSIWKYKIANVVGKTWNVKSTYTHLYCLYVMHIVCVCVCVGVEMCWTVGLLCECWRLVWDVTGDSQLNAVICVFICSCCCHSWLGAVTTCSTSWQHFSCHYRSCHLSCRRRVYLCCLIQSVCSSK